ncbi:MAG TPA: hypothetical protein VG899_07750 [Mycobacteriales bacterium]|nr:hypothetical protein [Mycobacteriales bacterium]HWA66247.1 hypothetical protein [Mycobacteriales bacterium]
MSGRKERLTVTVDPDLVAAGNDAVASGLADSLSGWVNEALATRAARDRRLTALAAAVADYESQFGEISPAEITDLRRTDQATAVVVRGRRSRTPRAATTKRTRRGVA